MKKIELSSSCVFKKEIWTKIVLSGLYYHLQLATQNCTTRVIDPILYLMFVELCYYTKSNHQIQVRNTSKWNILFFTLSFKWCHVRYTQNWNQWIHKKTAALKMLNKQISYLFYYEKDTKYSVHTKYFTFKNRTTLHFRFRISIIMIFIFLNDREYTRCSCTNLKIKDHDCW